MSLLDPSDDNLPLDSPSGGGGSDSAPSFANDVKPLFRSFDRVSMQDVFDLWSYDDVKSHADAIYAQVSTGHMPCDAPWAQDKVATFKNWMDAGYPP